ncbi:cytochrome d ubiquinol oxidase subunit II [Pendulispora albinea]|uniref:Cytochrome d ubiquinol oxidase subunit II n=1 Tax=Pendulispora albinea TaxID=2741071 RepID=A0ABZ2M073_9BACT
MVREVALAGVALAAVVAYGVLGGADFGGGVWDILARGPRKQDERNAIAHTMGPVWEANHVWLIFVIVILFTAFPRAYAELSIGLFLPFHLVLIGISLRGGAFVFRAHGGYVDAPGQARAWGVVFGGASVITPVLLGMSLGAVSSGLRVVGPLPLAMGALALAICAYLAAVYLTLETDENQGDLRAAFRRKALYAGTVVVALSGIVLPLTYFEAPHLWAGLTSATGAPVVGAGVLAAWTSGGALVLRKFRLARLAAAAQVAFLVAGWGLAQYPYLIYPSLTLFDAAAPPATLDFVLYTLPFGLLLVLPSLIWLFRVFSRARPFSP